MAKVTKRIVVIEPAKPAVSEKRFILELTETEAAILRTFLGRVSGPIVPGNVSPTYDIFDALSDACAGYHQDGERITIVKGLE